jgi:tRNA(fMet)-specific endonuclease VapC
MSRTYELRPVGTVRSALTTRRARRELLATLPILSFDARAADIAATLALDLRSQPIGTADLLVAAVALAHEAPLLTRNLREFSRVRGLELVEA